MILSCRKGLYNQYYVYTPLHVAGQIKNKEHAEPKEESCSTRRAWLHAAMPLALLLGIMESLVTAKVDVGQVTHCSWSSQCNRLLATSDTYLWRTRTT